MVGGITAPADGILYYLSLLKCIKISYIFDWECDIWAPPFGRSRLGATVWALTVWATGHMGTRKNGRRRFGAGRFSATVT